MRARIQTYLAGVAIVTLVSSGGHMEVAEGESSGDSDLRGYDVHPGWPGEWCAVTPSFKSKTECTSHVCQDLFTCDDNVVIQISVYYKSDYILQITRGSKQKLHQSYREAGSPSPQAADRGYTSLAPIPPSGTPSSRNSVF
jgi:hypothetical protein